MKKKSAMICGFINRKSPTCSDARAHSYPGHRPSAVVIQPERPDVIEIFGAPVLQFVPKNQAVQLANKNVGKPPE